MFLKLRAPGAVTYSNLERLLGVAAERDQHRSPYQDRQNPYSWKLFGELQCVRELELIQELWRAVGDA